MGTFQGLCGTYMLWLTEAFVVVQARIKASASAVFPSGRWEVFKVLCGTHRLQFTKASFADVQARIKASASAFFPSGRWEVFKVLCGTYILKMTEALAAVVQARIKTSA